MKKFQQFVMVVLVGAGVALGPGSLAGWARPNPPFDGHDHDHGHGRDKEWKHRGSWHEGHGREHWDNGRHRGWYRDGRGYYRFDDDDRRGFVAYFRDHEDEDEDWFREPGPPGVVVGYGYVVAPRYRGYCHPLPAAMLEELPPPPPRHRYFIFGGNVVLVDNGYRVQDFISLNFNFGR
ncbi:MAG: hypothetical protein EPN47_11980 [Acidobacteria bacterium]|nr:MAG: hypothetical protein EPN47_11980 [Acidobacteriota bacterium]